MQVEAKKPVEQGDHRGGRREWDQNKRQKNGPGQRFKTRDQWPFLKGRKS